MVPVRVPIIDYDNPFYCPNLRQFHSGAGANADLCIASFPGKPLPALARDWRRSNSSIYAIVHRPSHVMNDVPKKPVARRRFANLPHDSSPCARYTSHPAGLNKFGVPVNELKDPRKIRLEVPSPVLPTFVGEVEEPHSVGKQGNEKNNSPYSGVRLDSDAEYRSSSHQALVNMLGEKGALNEHVLTAFRDAEFSHLDLGPTMRGVNELRLSQGDVMRAFSQPGWFKKLRILSFKTGRFQDDLALAQIRPLCQIHTLVLTDTGIGNEGVFHIVALKCGLQHLDLSENPSINDDSVPALTLLENLQYLSIFGTGILMPGLRRLTMAMKEGKRVLNIRVPTVCKDYIDGMERQYLVQPELPLISDPGAISTLSKEALSYNLETHAAINSCIVSTGSRDEMKERDILEVRNLDLVVRDMPVRQDERWSST